MSKVKVIEVEATKLDKDAVYLIVFNSLQLPRARMNQIVGQMDDLKIKAIYTEAVNPEEALKVYQIPTKKEINEL